MNLFILSLSCQEYAMIDIATMILEPNDVFCIESLIKTTVSFGSELCLKRKRQNPMKPNKTSQKESLMVSWDLV